MQELILEALKEHTILLKDILKALQTEHVNNSITTDKIIFIYDNKSVIGDTDSIPDNLKSSIGYEIFMGEAIGNILYTKHSSIQELIEEIKDITSKMSGEGI